MFVCVSFFLGFTLNKFFVFRFKVATTTFTKKQTFVNPNPRQLLLLQAVQGQGSVTVDQLADTLGVTLQTVRRDVQRMADDGLLTRFHGGVRVPSSTIENIAHPQRENLHADGKARIARAVAAEVPNGCSLILNIGTTTEAIAKALMQHKGLRVITNNLNVAAILSGNPDLDEIKRKVCAEDSAHRTFVDIADYRKDIPANGPKGHPNDRGMALIADTIYAAIASRADKK